MSFKMVAIVGNGLSRKDIDLKKVQEYMPIYGCNALYRTFKPDLLFAIDDAIINEVLESCFPNDRFIVPPVDEQYEPAEWNPNRPRENAGMVAMRHAIKEGYDELHCFGMDFLIHNEEFNMGNVFEGTPCYGPNTRASFQDCMNRAAYFNWFIDQYPNVMFYAIFPESIIQNNQFRVQPRTNFQYFSS